MSDGGEDQPASDAKTIIRVNYSLTAKPPLDGDGGGDGDGAGSVQVNNSGVVGVGGVGGRRWIIKSFPVEQGGERGAICG